MSKKEEMNSADACESLARCLCDAINALNSINKRGHGGADYPYKDGSPQLARWRSNNANDIARDALNDAAELIWNETTLNV